MIRGLGAGGNAGPSIEAGLAGAGAKTGAAEGAARWGWAGRGGLRTSHNGDYVLIVPRGDEAGPGDSRLNWGAGGGGGQGGMARGPGSRLKWHLVTTRYHPANEWHPTRAGGWGAPKSRVSSQETRHKIFFSF